MCSMPKVSGHRNQPIGDHEVAPGAVRTHHHPHDARCYISLHARNVPKV